MGCVINNRWYLLDYAEKKGLPKIYDLLDKLQVKEGSIACTDGKIIYIDPDIFNAEVVENQFFILCHEMLHIIYKHPEMSKSPDYSNHELLNICQDVVINEYLQKRLRYKEPNGLYLENLEQHLKNLYLLPQHAQLRYNGQLTTRDLYKYLDRIIPYSKMDDVVKGLIDKVREHNEPDQEPLQSELIPGDVIKQACGALKIDKAHIAMEQGVTVAEAEIPGVDDGGSLPQELKGKKILSTKDIIDFCKQFVGTHAVVKGRSQTFTRPNRRIQSPDYVMKGYKYTKNIKEIVIYLDTSGSMDSQFISDMFLTLQTLYQTTKFRLYEFKGSVREVNLKSDYIYATGGTYITGVLNHIKRNKFDQAIMITDCQDRFSLKDVDSDLLIFTNNLNFIGDNPKVKVAYFKQ